MERIDVNGLPRFTAVLTHPWGIEFASRGGVPETIYKVNFPNVCCGYIMDEKDPFNDTRIEEGIESGPSTEPLLHFSTDIGLTVSLVLGQLRETEGMFSRILLRWTETDLL
jgi:hypothetical protein